MQSWHLPFLFSSHHSANCITKQQMYSITKCWRKTINYSLDFLCDQWKKLGRIFSTYHELVLFLTNWGHLFSRFVLLMLYWEPHHLHFWSLSGKQDEFVSISGIFSPLEHFLTSFPFNCGGINSQKHFLQITFFTFKNKYAFIFLFWKKSTSEVYGWTKKR